MKYYKQCKLKRGENIFCLPWIPEKFAKKGKYLKLKTDIGIWEDGWLVQEVYGIRKREDAAIRDSEIFKKMRIVTDI